MQVPNPDDLSKDKSDITPNSQKEEGQLNKKRRVKAINVMFIIGLWIIFGVIILLLLVRITHLVIPDCYHWLQQTQIDSIEKLLFSGAIGALIGKYFNEMVRESFQ